MKNDEGGRRPRPLTDIDLAALERLMVELQNEDRPNMRDAYALWEAVESMLPEVREARKLLRFVLSEESGFACPTSTEERIRAFLAEGSGNAPQAPTDPPDF